LAFVDPAVAVAEFVRQRERIAAGWAAEIGQAAAEQTALLREHLSEALARSEEDSSQASE
jgi:hypothetical protein